MTLPLLASGSVLASCSTVLKQSPSPIVGTHPGLGIGGAVVGGDVGVGVGGTVGVPVGDRLGVVVGDPVGEDDGRPVGLDVGG